jgi:hypothetical protein
MDPQVDDVSVTDDVSMDPQVDDVSMTDDVAMVDAELSSW